MFKKVNNPPNRFSASVIEWLDEPPDLKLEIYEEKAKSIISSNNSPDISFTHSLNPYRGCHHGCAYCYARPTHQYLDFGAGTDFERKIIVKINAPEKLREEFMKKSWKGGSLVFSGVTDCYQPLEASYQLTRRCLEVCEEFCNPVAVITKGALIRRDIDLLKSLNEKTYLKVFMSIAFSDDDIARKIEPYAPRPSIRFKAMEELAKAGIKLGVGIAPVIPGLNDRQIPTILKWASDCGAETAFMTLLRLPLEVKDVFLKNIRENFPDRYDKITNQIKSMRSNKLNQYNFGERMRGSGNQWEVIDFIFKQSCEKYGFNKKQKTDLEEEKLLSFKRPERQLALFA
jgi:DNA repair photolyase